MMTLIKTRSKDTNAVSSMRKVFARLRKWRSIRMLFPFLSEKGGMRIHMNSCEYLSVALNRGSVQSTSIVETPSGGLGVTFLIPNVGDRTGRTPLFPNDAPPDFYFNCRIRACRNCRRSGNSCGVGTSYGNRCLSNLCLCAHNALRHPYELTEQCVRRSKDTPLLSAICRA